MQKTPQLEIRLLNELDLPAALRLKELARWNQTESDWRRLLRLEPSGCFCATVGGRLVATTTTTTYGSELAWIGMVLVDPDYRRRGIATQLMHCALDYLREARVAAVKLDATPAGRQVYENLGFNAELLVERWVGVAGDTPALDCVALDASLQQEVKALDQRAFGADRSKLIGMLRADACVTPLMTVAADGRLNGYALARQGSDAAYVGPIVSSEAEKAGLLLDGLLKQLAGQMVYVDVNTKFKNGQEILASQSFVKQRDLIRMGKGNSSAGTSAFVFAIAGPELG